MVGSPWYNPIPSAAANSSVLSRMLHYRRYGMVLPRGDSFAGALASVLQTMDTAGLAAAPLRFLFDDAPGGAACARILERFPEMAPFAVPTSAQVGRPA